VLECPTCGKQLEQTVRFCPHDGTPLTDTAAASGSRTPTSRPQRAAELVLPITLGQRYRLEELRGDGGMARVYRAVDLTLERDVAVKLIDPNLREDPEFDGRFQREARIASQLADPHIVVVHDFGLDVKHGPFLVMEYLRGESLRERLQSQGPLPLRPVLQLCQQVLLALIHAHDKGIVHRDIKPDNLFLLNQSGVRLHVRVLDFGIARILRRDEPGFSQTLTRPGAVVGTPRYMAPEQLAGQPADARSDLYSAALVIYEAMTGTLPYVSHKKLLDICPDAPPALQGVLEQCLEQNPAERPASALEVYLRLQEPCRASGVLLLPPNAMEKLAESSRAHASTLEYVPRGSRKWPARLAFGILAASMILVLGLGAWVCWTMWKSPPALPVSTESLLDLKIGASRDEVVGKFGKPEDEREVVPFLDEITSRHGALLSANDLGDEDNFSELKVLSWRKGQVEAVIDAGRLRALIIHVPYRAASGRRVKIGDKESHLIHEYNDAVAVESSHALPEQKAGNAGTARRAKIYRYDELGISYEVVNELVVAIAVYPPVQPGTKSE
jgi:hypothetical protein